MLVLPMAAYFIDDPLQYVFGLVPPYWIFKAWWVAADGGSMWWAYALNGVFTNVVLLGWIRLHAPAVAPRHFAGSSPARFNTGTSSVAAGFLR